MANICEYSVRVKGSQKAGKMVYESMPCLDFKEKDDDQPGYAICFSGDCKWSVNYEAVDLVPYININSWSENEIDEQASNYVCYSLRAKSEALDCEILVHYWSEESGFDQFDHYNRGTVVKQRKIAYGGNPASFDWDKTEFIGHEGEYDESVDGEVLDAQFINLLTNAVNILEKPDSDDDVDDNDDETTVDLPKNTPAFSGDPNMFRWTFTSGKTAKTDDWTMSIPDGFKSIKPIDQDRAFTLVPESENSSSLEDYHISILPGGKSAAMLADKEYWHPYPTARKGVSALLHAMFSEQIGGLSAKLMGVAAVGEIYATAWDDVSGIVEIFDTDDSSYSFQCQIDRGDGTYMLRIQTLSINDEQKYDLLDSVIKLLHTIKFNNPNTVCPQKFLIENEDVYLDLVKGKTTKFEEAIDKINAARNAVYNGQIKLITLMAEYGTMDVTSKRGHDYIEQIHKDVIDVMDHCYKLVDKLISRLVDNKTVSVMPAVLEKMKELNPFEIVTHMEHCTVSVPLTDDLKFIREKWTKLAKDYGIDFTDKDHEDNSASNTPPKSSDPSNPSNSSDESKSSPNQEKAKPQTQKNYSKYSVDDSYETKCRNERERFEKECKELAEKIKSDNESNRNKELRKIEKDYDKEYKRLKAIEDKYIQKRSECVDMLSHAILFKKAKLEKELKYFDEQLEIIKENQRQILNQRFSDRANVKKSYSIDEESIQKKVKDKIKVPICSLFARERAEQAEKIVSYMKRVNRPCCAEEIHNYTDIDQTRITSILYSLEDYNYVCRSIKYRKSYFDLI